MNVCKVCFIQNFVDKLLSFTLKFFLELGHIGSVLETIVKIGHFYLV